MTNDITLNGRFLRSQRLQHDLVKREDTAVRVTLGGLIKLMCFENTRLVLFMIIIFFFTNEKIFF